VDGLLDAYEVSVRSRVEVLRAEAARVAAQLTEAETVLEHVGITRATLAAVLAGNSGIVAETQSTDGPSLVPVRRADLTEEHLPAEYRRVWLAIVAASGPVRAKELAGVLGLETSAAKVEGLRSKLKRLAARGWIAEPAPGAFALASTGPASPGGGS
jgi:hypothetical protein